MFYDRLRALCKEKGTSLSAVLKELGLSTGSTGSWKRGQLPKGDILASLAEYLDTSIDYIIFGEYKTDLTDDEKKLVELYRTTPERAKYKVLCDIDAMITEEIEKYAKEKGTG